MQRIRDDVYGNCYLQGSERSVNRGKETILYFKFWSSNNEFFRCDQFSDPNYEDLTDRIILRPERFPQLSEEAQADVERRKGSECVARLAHR